MKKWLVGLTCVGMMVGMAWGQATLPTTCSGPWTNAVLPTGWSATGLGADYSGASGGYDGMGGGAARFDGANDAVTVSFDSAPGAVTYWARLNVGTGVWTTNIFKLQESANGTDWTDVTVYDAANPIPVTAPTGPYTSTPSATARHLRFLYVQKGNGNVGVDGVTITSGGPVVFQVTFDRTNGFQVEQGSSAAVTATAANGTAPYTYGWSSTLDAAQYTAVEGVFTILATATIGDYTAQVIATDSALAAVTNSLSFSVVAPAPKYAITITPPANGTVTTAPETEAAAGAVVTITATPAGGHVVDAITVTGADATPITVTGNTFVMPAQAVTVAVTFRVFVASAVFISEVADPGDAAGGTGARFVELHNGGAEAVDLAAGTWFLAKQVNGGTIYNLPLTGSLAAGGTYVVAVSNEYSTYYPTAPAANLITNFVSGNGDDGYYLYSGGGSSTGTLQDAFGVLGEDGTGKAWEYEDSRAVRNAEVTGGNPTWTAAEWTIPASALIANMTPGVHPDSAAGLAVAFDKTNGFVVGVGAGGAITATAQHGTAPYTYGWSSTLDGAHYTAAEGVFTILTTAPAGDYTATATATDAAAQGATNTISFSVVTPNAITIAPAANGTVTTAPATEAIQGATVTITETPATNYAVGSIAVVGADATPIPVNGATFVMPAQAVTVTVAFVLDIATLPIAESYTDTMDWTTIPGWSGVSISTYADGDASFNLTGDALTVRFDGAPSNLTFDVQGRSTTSGTAPMQFVVEESANGTDWTTVATIGETEINGTTTPTSFGPYALQAATRQVRWTLVNKYNFNVGLNNVAITAGAGGATLSYTGATTILMGEAFSLTFTLNGGTATGWEYLLESAGREELGTGNVNVFSWTPPSAGTYYLTMSALDATNGVLATREVTLTVNSVGHPDIPAITVVPGGGGDFAFEVPTAYALVRVEGATPAQLAANTWTTLTQGVDYTVSGTTVRILTTASAGRAVRIWIQ